MILLLIATRNAHKVQEIRQILGKEFVCLTLNEFPGAPAVVEDADSFEGNAAKKSVSLAKWLHHSPEIFFTSLASVPDANAVAAFFVLADDSGLEVDALDGAPGVFSARFAATDAGAAGNSPDAANNAKLLRLLQAVPLEKRSARFRCALAATKVLYSIPTRKVLPITEHQIISCDGACEGRISFAPSGRGGFGYDPLFVPEGYDQSFAELGEEIKNQLSHRAHALQRLKALIEGIG